jgi:CRP/FNR family transcriptional regulator, polysaccharide utilization system transcription regulator
MKTITSTDKEFFCDIQAPCFQLLTKEEMEQIQSSRTQVLFRKGENLTKQGAFSTYVLFIITGFVKQLIEGDGTKGYNLRIIRPGGFLGLASAFDRNTFDYSAVALTETQAILIEKEAISKLIKKDGNFAFSIIKRYYAQNSHLYDTIHKLVYKQMNGRLADALLYLSQEEFSGMNIFPVLSRKDLAEFAGISTESTVKLLKQFEKDGLLKLADKDIILLNHDALSDISKKG